MKKLYTLLLLFGIFPSIATPQTSTSAVMQVSVRVTEGFTATVLSTAMIQPTAPLSAEYHNDLEIPDQHFGRIGLRHPPSGEYILNYPEELTLVNQRGDQIRYSTTLTKKHTPGSSRCELTLKGNKLDKAGTAGSFYGIMTVKIAYL